jgi:predicted GTPase
MGATGTGKSQFINCASGSDFVVGHALESCTAEVKHTEPFELDDRKIILVDTPGSDDTNRKEVDILNAILTFLTDS